MKIQCCKCNRFKAGDRWVLKAPPMRKDERVSHGYCPECATKAFEEIRELEERDLVVPHHA